MEFDEIERMVVHQEPMTEEMSLPDMECYRCMMGLYTAYRQRRIGAEQAGREKKLIHAAFGRALDEYQQRAKAWRDYQDNIRLAGEKRTRLAREAQNGASVEWLLDTALDTISLMCGEPVTADSVRKSLENRPRVEIEVEE